MTEHPEQWIPIGQYPAYDVSDRGRIRSWKTHRGQAGPRILHPSPDSKGYLTTALFNADGRRTVKVHVLVAAAFLGPRPDGLEIRHLDSNPANNRVENLRYGTYDENLQDRIDRKTHCKSGHPLSGPNMYYRSNSRARACRECLRIADRKRRVNERAVSA